MEKRTKDNPWGLKTPPGTSEYQMWMDEKDGIEIIVCKVGCNIRSTSAKRRQNIHRQGRHTQNQTQVKRKRGEVKYCGYLKTG